MPLLFSQGHNLNAQNEELRFDHIGFEQGLSNDKVTSIFQDSKGYIWIGTYTGGLNRWDKKTNQFTHYRHDPSNPKSLRVDAIAAIMEDRHSRLWVCNGDILSQFNKQTAEFTHYYTRAKNNKEGNQRSILSIAEDQQGFLWLGTVHYTFRVKGTNYDGVWNEEGTSISLLIKPPWWRTWWVYSFYGVCFIALLVLLVKNQRVRIIKRERERTRERELEQGREIEKAYHALKSTQEQLMQAEKMASLGELTAGIAHEIKNPLNFINNFSEINLELLTEIDEDPSTKVAAVVPVEIQTIKNLKKNSEKINHHGKRVDSIVKGMLLHSRLGGLNKELIDINALCEETIKLAYHGYRAKEKTFNAAFETRFDPDLPKVSGVPQDLGRVILNIINNAL